MRRVPLLIPCIRKLIRERLVGEEIHFYLWAAPKPRGSTLQAGSKSVLPAVLLFNTFDPSIGDLKIGFRNYFLYEKKTPEDKNKSIYNKNINPAVPKCVYFTTSRVTWNVSYQKGIAYLVRRIIMS
jgi:hypothetical protein